LFFINRLFSKINRTMPSSFMENPEKVHRAIEAINGLESALTDEPVVAEENVEAQLETEDAAVNALELLQL
jgi:hypothetical protein